MAGAAIQRQIDELAFICDAMAIVAADVLMPAPQRKTRGLMRERDFGNILPGVYRMAA